MPSDLVRVAIVDDHALLREGLKELLQVQKNIDVVGEAGDSSSAIALVADRKPDVVLLDIEIPGDDVTTTVRRVMAVSPHTRVIILTMYDAPSLVQSLVALGIKGYLLKSVSSQQLVAAINNAIADESIVTLSVSPQGLAQSDTEILSPRERAVLQLVASAMSNTQIASRLSLTEATVKRHLHNIFTKIGAVSRIDAVNKAIAASLISPPELKSERRAPTPRGR
jgi:DNA-binding NarL/FixJ family response regulator